MSPDHFERGSAAKAALSVFYESFNDLDIYVEDTAEGYDKIFARLLSRALDGKVAIEKVFPLGERGKVIESARAYEQKKSTRNSVHIVDGDLNLLCGESQALPKNLIVLPRYCIENFLFDKESLLQILDEEDTKHDIGVLELALDFENWIESLGSLLRPLFCIFAVAHFLNSGIKTIKNGSKSVCKDELGNIDSDKVKALVERIHLELSATHGVCVVEYYVKRMEANISSELCFASTYVSAKDFVLPLLFLRIRSISSSKAKHINLKIRLASKCRVDIMAPISDRIKNILVA